jgi:hypothetical protein
VTVRAASLGFLVSTLAAGCGEDRETLLAVEGARAGCVATLQAIYGPETDKEAVMFERVPNGTNETDRFEFVWTSAQISGLASVLATAEREALGIKPSPPDRQVVVLGPARDYVCRGSLRRRLIDGIWRRARNPAVTPYEVRITEHPVSF